MEKKKHLRRRQCGKKHRHREYSSAWSHAKHLWLKDGERLAIYKCRWCGCFHVGHKT